MSGQKSLNNIEDLLKIAEDDTQSKIVSDKDDDILTFILEFDIKPGNETVSSRALYSLYQAWSKRAQTKANFTRKINEVLPEADEGFYKIQKSFLEINSKKLNLLAKKRPKITKRSINRRLFDTFLKEKKFEPGTFWIEDVVFYKIYVRWAYVRRIKNPMSEELFKQFCKVYFEEKVDVRGLVFYGVGGSITSRLTEGKMKRIRDEKEKTLRSKTPRFRSKIFTKDKV